MASLNFRLKGRKSDAPLNAEPHQAISTKKAFWQLEANT
jgi:hypothetical protein